MDISAPPDASLADIYRQARALASADSARPEAALSLCEAIAAAFPQGARAGVGGALGPEERRRDQARRAAIAALRHQAMLLRRDWVAGNSPSAEGAPGAQALLVQATVLAEAALALHREGEGGRKETEYIVRFLRTTAAIAATPPVEPESGPTPSPEIVVVGLPPQPLPEAPAPPHKLPAPPQALPALEEPLASAMEPSASGGLAPPSPLRPTRAVRRPQPRLVGALAAIAVIGFLAGAVTIPRLRNTPRQADKPVSLSSPAVAISPRPGRMPEVPPALLSTPEANAPSAVPPAPSPAAPPLPGTVSSSPHPAPLQPAALPQRTPPPARPTVALLLRSQPSGAQVYIGTTLKGTTPLRLYAPPGTVLTVTLRRGSRIWRGTVRLGDRPTQAVTVSLPAPAAQVAPRPVPSPPRPEATRAPSAALAVPSPAGPPTATRQAHHDALMARGLELYRAGWYGPAMGQFKQAAAVVPTPRAYLWIGRAAFKAGRFAEARRALERVVELAPGTEAAREAQRLLNRLRSAGFGGQS